MKCPACPQVDLVMAERQGVEIDYCPQCRGVWLDRGELDKIIDRSSAAQPQPPRQEERGSRPLSQDHQDYGYHKKKKRKSLLGELFDF
jgi:hypothetical protein